MIDELGIRIKEQYENRTRYFLPRRTYTLLRLDGKSFHNYARNLKKPFDNGLSEDIDNTVISMLSEIQGAVFAYNQSDEISILLTDFATPNTDAWFDGNIQKICSVSSSIMTAEFNKLRLIRIVNPDRDVIRDYKLIFQQIADSIDYKIIYQQIADSIDDNKSAYFDARCFTIPDRIEVMNYMRWRQADCIRNSVSMVAQSKFSHKELHGKSQGDMHEMLHNIGVNWAKDFTDGHRNGRIITKKVIQTGIGSLGYLENKENLMRTKWVSNGAWIFTKDEGKLLNMIPTYV